MCVLGVGHRMCFFIFLLRFFKNLLQTTMACIAIMAITIALINLRSHFYLKIALHPSIDGVDVMVQGMVTHMPKKNENGVRFRFEVEKAWRIDDDQSLEILPMILIN